MEPAGAGGAAILLDDDDDYYLTTPGYPGSGSNASLSPPADLFPAASNHSTAVVVSGDLDLYVIIPLGIFLAVLSLVTFAGNVMVLHALRTEKKLQTVSNIFIMSLAIADCSVGLFAMPLSAVYALLGYWPFGLVVCNMWLSMDYVASTASIFNLFALSLDRFWSIISPLRYLKKRTRKRAIIMCSSVWLASLLWIIPVVGWHQMFNDGRRDVPVEECDTEFADEQVFKVLTAIFNFYVPMAAMIALYGRIFHEIKLRAKSFEEANSAVTHSSSQRKKDPSEKAPKATLTTAETATTPLANGTAGGTNGQLLPYYCDAPANGIPQIVVETPDDGTPGLVKKRRIVEYDGITLIHLSDKFVSMENLEKEEFFDDVDVCVEWDSDSEVVTTLQLPESTIDDDCVSLSDFDIEEDEEAAEQEAERKKKVKKRRKRKFPKMSTMKFTRKLSLSRTPSTQAQAQAVVPTPTPSPRPSDPTPTLPSPSSKKRLLTMMQSKKAASAHTGGVKDQPNKFKREKKAAFQLGVILGAFCLCFMPYFISFIITAFCKDCVSPAVHSIFTWLGYVNSTTNPFLYTWTNANFRSAFRKILRMKETPKKPVYMQMPHKTPRPKKQPLEARVSGTASGGTTAPARKSDDTRL
ncbi:putative Histamine H1 receptor [Hypsibius exemplaris]|uniref:Histamine H1 receptor n=1 Tax=Hypsibius exemplaris TaxID=2072580 RepID=A0A1W0WWJ2_HYPEX|nr:putative Histamine H1 receptor [Hypsibius exemplaris]